MIENLPLWVIARAIFRDPFEKKIWRTTNFHVIEKYNKHQNYFWEDRPKDIVLIEIGSLFHTNAKLIQIHETK